ncbi:flagellar biosynthetic protein FliO [Alcaligenaceae bacterium]|nr:flagellar biosynthetic protein FliO [Alcaligenaceae bacterium]
MNEADTLRLVISLIFIVMLILAGAWLTRRAGWLRTGGNQSIRVVGSQSLGAKAYVALVEVEDARLVLGITSNQISLLHTLPPIDPSARSMQTDPPANGFSATLGKIMKGR